MTVDGSLASSAISISLSAHKIDEKNSGNNIFYF